MGKSGLCKCCVKYDCFATRKTNSLQEKQTAVYFNNPDIPFHINFCQPYYYQLTNAYNVGYTPWESTKIPPGWLYNMNVCNEIWTTSSFVKDIYIQNGVRDNIHVIPHGVSEDFAIVERELLNKFNFLHVGGDSKRKNAQLVVDAFLELFDGNEDYQLILKYNNFCYAEIYLDGKLVQATEHPQIIGIPEIFSAEDLVRLYHKCHCLVYPTSGEGFGMIPFEAMATGMPTIVTNLTGCADFAHYGIPLEAEYGEATYNNHQYSTDTGLWAVPNFDELVIHMQDVAGDYDLFKKSAIHSAKIIHQEHSWSATADKILARLAEFDKKK